MHHTRLVSQVREVSCVDLRDLGNGYRQRSIRISIFLQIDALSYYEI